MRGELKSGYKQTEVGVIPEEWDVVTLNGITSEIGDGIHATPRYSASGDYFFVNGNNIQNGSIVITKETKSADASEFKKYRKDLSDRTLLLSINGTIGNIAIYSGEPIFLGKSAAYLNIDKNTSRTFIFYLLQTAGVTAYFNEGLTGTTIKNLGLATIRNTPVPLPPTRAEQEAIADALSDTDALIESLEQLITKKRQIKQGTMQDLLTGNKRLPGFRGEWETRALGDVAPLQRGFDLPNSKLQQGVYPVVYSNGVLNHHAAFQVKGPGVVTGRSGTIGTVTFVEQNFWPHNTSLWVTTFKSNDPKFVFYLYTTIGLEQFATGSGVPTLNRNDVHDFKVRIPPSTAEQTAIATILFDMDAEIAALEAKLSKARQLKQGMMQALLTGKTRLVESAK